MQTQARRYLILGGTAIVLLLIVFVTLHKSASTEQSTCNKFIKDIIAQDVDKSYALFSDGAKSLQSKDAWKIMMQGLQSSHYQAKFTLKSTNDLTATPTQAQPKPLVRKQLNYFISSPPLAVDANCTVTQTSSGFLIDGYSVSEHTDTGTKK